MTNLSSRAFINTNKVFSNVGESSGYFYLCGKQFVNLFASNCCFDVAIIPTCQGLQTFKFEVADVNAPSENERRTEPKVESSLEHVHFRRSSSYCPVVLL